MAKNKAMALVGLFSLLGAGTALAQDKSSTAEDVLAAQYAAKSKPVPMQADEAERIHEEYLAKIGKKLPKASSTSQTGNGQ
jgi:hypothetical protein